jgi:hypothetical protein
MGLIRGKVGMPLQNYSPIIAKECCEGISKMYMVDSSKNYGIFQVYHFPAGFAGQVFLNRDPAVLAR